MEITKEIAEKFLSDNDSVDLCDFKTLEDIEAAKVLAKHEGELWLLGLETLGDAAASELARQNGVINLMMDLGESPGHKALQKKIDEQTDEVFELDLSDDSRINLELLSAADRGTLSEADRNEFLQENTTEPEKIAPYFKRVGPGLGHVAVELKRELSRQLMPAFLKELRKVTKKRCTKAFLDIKIYSKHFELAQWTEPNQWEGDELAVVAALVVEVPEGESLDREIQSALTALFDDGSLSEYLNLDIVAEMLGEYYLSDFEPDSFGGCSLKIFVDGCQSEHYAEVMAASFGPQIQKLRLADTPLERNAFEFDLNEDLDAQMRELISILANKLGNINLNPKKLQNDDSLYALMGFDDTLALSLEKSIAANFDIIGGAGRIITVENAISFAREMKEMRSED
jgi:hypothetical protein